MRRLLSALILIGVWASGPNASAQEPYHVFNFSPPAAYWQQDNDTVGRRLRAGEQISGDVILSRCEIIETEEFKAGFRLKVLDQDEESSLFVGFVCDPDTGDLVAGYRRFIGEKMIEELALKYIGQRGELVTFSAQIIGGELSVRFGTFNHKFELKAKPHVTAYYGFGTTGRARFFETEPNIS